MAHLHHHTGQQIVNHINFGAIGQKIKMFGEVAAAAKGVVETAIYLKNTLAPVASTVAALAV